MIVGIHQPHYYPWMGYFDKMAKSDVFILLDDIQLEKGSYMYRNRIINEYGKIAYLTISGDKHGFLERSYKDILSTNDADWLEKHAQIIERSYSKSPYFNEVWENIHDLFETQEITICAYCVRSVLRIKDLLGIKTKIVMQSDLQFDESKKKNELVVNLCKAIEADKYLSGNGARKYTNDLSFEEAGIQLQYQQFSPPIYDQIHTQEFVSGLSMLDLLFNCGLTKANILFWETKNKGKEFMLGE